jgi:flagellar biogenesis protein FliO
MFDAISDFFSIVFALAMFAAVVWLSYKSTKWLARAKTAIGGANLRVVESAALCQGSSAAIIKAGKEYFLVGVTKENVSLIARLEAESLELPANPPGGETFARYFSERLSKMFKPKRTDDDGSVDPPCQG